MSDDGGQDHAARFGIAELPDGQGLIVGDPRELQLTDHPMHGPLGIAMSSSDELLDLADRIERMFDGRDRLSDSTETRRAGGDSERDGEPVDDPDAIVRIEHSEQDTQGVETKDTTFRLKPGDTLELPAPGASVTSITVNEDASIDREDEIEP